ncbi:MAG: UdgX family uracil-DNA binding protein [Acetobacter sp.]
MAEVVLAHQVDFATWRNATRQYALAGALPDSLRWRVGSVGQDALWTATPATDQPTFSPALNLSRRFVGVLGQALQRRDAERFTRLYRIVYRLAHDGLDLTDASDPDLMWLRQSVAAVRADTLRFREAFSAFSASKADSYFCTSPEHYIVEANSRFCMERNARPWQVVTPYRQMEWTGSTLRFAAPTQTQQPDTATQWQMDGTGIWRGYALSVLPPRRNDVEAATTLAMLGAQAMDCRACALWRPASRTVFGEGPEHAAIMLVGEQPGDQEDQQGRPFVGPAGQMLDKALQEAGIQRDQVYVTNALKHFHFTWNGSRRLHHKPEAEHMAACRVWLDAERRLVRPALLVMLGATAASSVLQKPTTIARTRSRLFPLDGTTQGLVTVHPSYLLRLPDEASRMREYARFVEDLRLAASILAR